MKLINVMIMGVFGSIAFVGLIVFLIVLLIKMVI